MFDDKDLKRAKNPSQKWANYCQALRDVPAQAGFPWNVTWPEQPE